MTVLISWVLVPYADTYPDVRVSDYVAPGAMPIVREMTQRCPTEPGVIVSVLAALGVSEDRPLYVGDLTGGALGERLEQNAVTGKRSSPLLIAWGSNDEVIPKRLQDRFVERMCAEGNQVRWHEYPGESHLGVLQPGSPFLPLLVNGRMICSSGARATPTTVPRDERLTPGKVRRVEVERITEHVQNCSTVSAWTREHTPIAVIALGASGFIGGAVADAFVADGYDVRLVGGPLRCRWTRRRRAPPTVDGADVVVNFAGKSVNCRYTDANRNAILDSRVDTTRALREAIASAENLRASG